MTFICQVLFVLFVSISSLLCTLAKLQSFTKFKDSGYPTGTVFLKEKSHFHVESLSPMHCGTLCMYTPTCVGYFFRESEFCKLVASSKRDILILSVETIGTTYYEIQNKCLFYQYPCNAGQCIPNLHELSYTCQCPNGVTGENCTQGEYFVDDDNKDAQYVLAANNCVSGENNGLLLYSHNGGKKVTVAYRFELNGVSNFNAITSAKIYLTIKHDSNELLYDIKIKAMKRVDSTNDIEQCDFRNVDLRTTTEVIWSGPHPAKQVGDVIETPDISPVLNEVISMDGWNEGNRVDIIFFNDELPVSTSGKGVYRCYSAVDGIATAPKLVVSFN